jgi:RNA-directed DNA polymerase
MLRRIKAWLKVPVEERDGKGNRRMTGGRSSTCGTPQGGVVSPRLANLYMNRFLKGWRNTERGKQFKAQVVNYADDFVILSRGCAAQALEWTRQVMPHLGLTLNEAKTKLRQARRESFDFLGDTFGLHRYWKDGHGYLGASPSQKSLARVRQKVNAVLRPSNTGTWPEVRDRLNQILRGWSSYFSYGSRRRVYGAVDNHVATRVRHFLRRRRQLPSRGPRVLANEVIFGPLGVLQMRRVHLGARPIAGP